MTPPPEASDSRLKVLGWCIFAGFTLRVVLALVSLGGNDITTWFTFAEAVATNGLEATYLLEPRFNHPPLMGLMAAWLLGVSNTVQIAFPFVFKLPALVADGFTALLLYRIWSERAGREAGLRAAAAYAMALCAIMISGYHGNTDAIYFCLALAAAYAMEKRRPFWAGVAMGAALNVKVIPVMIVLPLWSRCMRLREAGRYALGGLVAAVPFLWALAVFAPEGRRTFLERLLLYRSNVEYWGVELVARLGRALLEPLAPGLAEGVRGLGDLYIAYGGEFVVVASAALALRHVLVSKRAGRSVLDSYELTFLGFAVFLLLGPGFGVQYVGCVVAPLIAMRIRTGFAVATVMGVYITSIYAYFVVDWSPIYSRHAPIPVGFVPLAIVAWLAVAWPAVGPVKALWHARGVKSSSGTGAETGGDHP